MTEKRKGNYLPVLLYMCKNSQRVAAWRNIEQKSWEIPSPPFARCLWDTLKTDGRKNTIYLGNGYDMWTKSSLLAKKDELEDIRKRSNAMHSRIKIIMEVEKNDLPYLISLSTTEAHCNFMSTSIHPSTYTAHDGNHF